MRKTSNTRPSNRCSQHARALIREMSVLLDEARISERIDEPVDSAVASFRFPDVPQYGHKPFHDLMTRFVRHLVAGMSSGGRDLPYDQAHDEAVSLIERLYDGEHGPGYSGAVADAADPEGRGMACVLLSLAERIKQHCRGLYRQWVAARYLSVVDWGTRCAAAEMLLQRCRHMLPAMVRDWPPERWADHVFVLVTVDLDTELTSTDPFLYPEITAQNPPH